MNYTQVLCLGDSITFGSRCKYDRGYPPIFSKMLTEYLGWPHICINAGVSQETSAQITRRAWQYLSNPDIRLLILIAGTNDSKPTVRTPPEIYAENIEQILLMATATETATILCNLPYLIPAGQPTYGVESPELIAKYNQEVERLARKYKITPVVNLYNFFKENPDKLADGVHPNSEGYHSIAQLLFERIIQGTSIPMLSMAKQANQKQDA